MSVLVEWQSLRKTLPEAATNSVLKTKVWVEIYSLALKPDFFMHCFPYLKEKSYFYVFKFSALSVLVLLLLVVFLEVGVVLFVF